MGRQRDSDMIKINTMESEMQEYGRQVRTSPTDNNFVLSKKAKAQFIATARRQGVPIEDILEKARGLIKEAIDSKIFTYNGDTLH